MSVLNQGIVLATSGSPVKRDKTHFINSWVFDTLGVWSFPTIATVAASTVNTTILAQLLVPQAIKIPKVMIGCTAIGLLSTTLSVNVVVGLGAYETTPGVIQTPPLDDQETYGYPTAYAANGQALFIPDIAFTAANFPGYFITNQLGVTQTVAPAITTGAGGVGEFIPYHWDAVIPPYSWLTVRAATPSGQTITNLTVSMVVSPVDQWPSGSGDQLQAFPSGGW